MKIQNNKFRIELRSQWHYLNPFKESPLTYFTLIRLAMEVDSSSKYFELDLVIMGILLQVDIYKKWLWKD